MQSKLVATILCSNCESIVQDAVGSVVHWVDEVCLIDTGITDGSFEKALAVAGSKLSRWKFDWCGDFAAARNAALDVARRAQATWSLTVDTDERLVFAGYPSRNELVHSLESDLLAKLWLVPNGDGSYAKERFIRLPTELHWHGPTHESLIGEGHVERGTLSGCSFWELTKSPAQFQYKLERDLVILLRLTADKPDDPRWWYYLGQTYEGLKLFRAAITAYERCFRLDGWADESSWACYAAARCLVELKEFRRAEEFCALGLSRKPSVAELPWLAGWCCYQRGAWQDAITWSNLAIHLSQNATSKSAAVFRHLPAWHEGPYEVLNQSLNHLQKRVST